MNIKSGVLLALATACGMATPALAQNPIPHYQNHHLDYFRNSLWPMPFRSQDSCSVLQYVEAQRNKGWQLANTLGTHCYDTNNKLTEAGHSQIDWILRKAPPDRRVVFVLRGIDDSHTRQRVEATQIAISRLLPTGSLPDMYVTNAEPLGSSGAYQTAVHRAIMETVPPPRLTVNAAASGGSASGGSGSGSTP